MMLNVQNQAIAEQSRQVLQLTSKVHQLAEGLTQLAVQPAPATVVVSSPTPTLPKPENYSGDGATCRGFLLQCQLYFTAHLNITKQSKLTVFMTLLTRNAMK